MFECFWYLSEVFRSEHEELKEVLFVGVLVMQELAVRKNQRDYFATKGNQTSAQKARSQ